MYFFYRDFHTDSNGCAAGNTLQEAIVQGFLELVERDAYAIWWYNRSQRSEVDLSEFDDSYVRDIKTQFTDAGRKLWVLDVTSDLGVPTYVAIMHWMQRRPGEYRVRLRRAFRSPHCLAAFADRTEPVPVDRPDGRRQRRQVEPRRHHAVAAGKLSVPAPGEPSERCARNSACTSRSTMRANRSKPASRSPAAPATISSCSIRPDPTSRSPVARVIVPGLRHFYRRFAPGRLYDVPVKLGLRDRPLPESELTPFLPHT